MTRTAFHLTSWPAVPEFSTMHQDVSNPQVCSLFARAVGWTILAGVVFGLYFQSSVFGQAWWPQFRGPSGSGIALDGDFPLHFGPGSNMVWRVSLGPGYSSPCIWDNRIFITAFTTGRLQTICLDRHTGAIEWERSVEPGPLEKGAGSPAAPTPAADGTNVYVYFGPFGLLAYDFAGQEKWRKPLPTPNTQHGAGASPLLAAGRLVLACDQDIGSFVMCLQAASGRILWRAERPGYRRGFATPLYFRDDGREVAIVAGTLRVTAYDLSTGGQVWSAGGLPHEMVSSPISGEGLIFVAGWTPGAGVPRLPSFDQLLQRGDTNGDGKLANAETPPGPARQHFQYIDANKNGVLTRDEWETMAGIFESSENALLALRPGGNGDITTTHLAWKQTRGLPYVPSLLCYQGILYTVKNGGLLSSYNAASGNIHYQEERLGALGDYYASPVAAAGKVLFLSASGVVTIIKAATQLEVLAHNSLGESTRATPAIAGKRLYVRTEHHLYAFGD